MSFAEQPASYGGLPAMMPPVAISLQKLFRNAHPADGPLPASERSCQYGGSSMVNVSSTFSRLASRSNFQSVTAPLYFSRYSLSGA